MQIALSIKYVSNTSVVPSPYTTIIVQKLTVAHLLKTPARFWSIMQTASILACDRTVPKQVRKLGAAVLAGCD